MLAAVAAVPEPTVGVCAAGLLATAFGVRRRHRRRGRPRGRDLHM
jgi:hypothetical protein